MYTDDTIRKRGKFMDDQENMIFGRSARSESGYANNNHGYTEISTRHSNTNNQYSETNFGRNSFFDGGLLSLIWVMFLGLLLTIFSLGILYPWAICLVYGWKINHTVIDGRRLHFSGSAIGLFGNWIKWLALSIITLGIYSFWVQIKLEDWKAKNTSFIYY